MSQFATTRVPLAVAILKDVRAAISEGFLHSALHQHGGARPIEGSDP
jgi:hypothetical protein